MENIQNLINSVVHTLNYYLWGYVIIALLLISGVYFTFKLRFSQITMLKHGFSLILKKDNRSKKTEHHISSFQAFATSMASVVGIGSIAGIAIAISLGGPGAVFWMWVISIISMATSIVEHTLGQVYKEKYVENNNFSSSVNKKNIYVGGPSYYISKGLKNNFLAYIFSIIIVITYGIVFNTIQSNTVGASFKNSFNIPNFVTGSIITFLCTITILGGIKRIAKISSIIVPIKAGIYLIIIVLVVIINIKDVPSILFLIVKSAFGIKEVVSGTATYFLIKPILIGIQRAMFSTESGLGSSPNITASAFVNHPTKQGFIAMVGVFIISFFVCTGTAIIVLSSNVYLTKPSLTGIVLTQESLRTTLGSIGVYVLSTIIFLFAFATIVGNYSYAEHNLNFIKPRRFLKHILRVLFICTIFLGSIASLQLVWDLSDLCVAAMILINIWAMLRLSKVAITVIFDYKKQLKNHVDPVFKKETIPALRNDESNVW